MSSHHKKAKQQTIGVIRRVNAKVSHYMGPSLIYPMENKMLFVHHVIKQWGCGYKIENIKGLNEKTQKTSNDETHVQVYVGGVGAREGIEPK
jgi:hypothetical protein